MADEDHLKIIEQGLEIWNARRRENPGISPNLEGADLSGEDLSQADFHRANLCGANLRGASLHRADLRGADLSGARLIKTDLMNADLTKANLNRAHLIKASLYGANLTEASLFRADVSNADLTSANLSRAHLSEAEFTETNLGWADLSQADLSRAHLIRTTLHGSDLSQADFSGALVGSTIFANNDLSTVKGLETLSHVGPSTIGVDTLLKSGDKIPPVFLRGVGLPESFITYLPSLTIQPIEFYSCFISYSHADKSFARRLHDTLQGRGIRCWLDEHQLLPGDKIYTEVDRGIRLWDKVLLCCSKDALTSWWVDNEIKIAFDKEQHLWRERKKEVLALIPLNLDDYLFSGKWQSGLATEVRARMAANFGGWEQDNQKFEAQFERLVKALRTGGRGQEPASPPTLL